MIGLLKGVVVRSLAEMKRYLPNLLASFSIFLIIFSLIALGFDKFGQAGSETFRGTAVGYFVWIVTMSSLTNLSWTLMMDMQRGIVEQVFLSHFHPLLVYSVYQLVDALFTFPVIYLMMVLIFKMAGMSVLVHPSFFYFLALVMLQSAGIGFALAGLTLRFKRTQAILNLVQFLVLGLLFLDSSGWKGIVIPIAPQFEAMKVAAEGGLPPISAFIASTIGTVLYITAGAVVFSIMMRSVLKRGELSTY